MIASWIACLHTSPVNAVGDRQGQPFRVWGKLTFQKELVTGIGQGEK